MQIYLSFGFMIGVAGPGKAGEGAGAAERDKTASLSHLLLLVLLRKDGFSTTNPLISYQS